jgi:predicted ATPase/class 3 adenylate cyclase
VTRLPTGTVTFLFTDVEGSTTLLERLGGEAYAAALAKHRRLVRDAVTRHGGVEVDTQGDALFMAFPAADGALAAAREAQEGLADGPIRVRMGLHTGEPVVTAEGYVGMDVHRGARIAAAGHGGQVLLSERTRLTLTDGAELRDLGEQRLKDLGAPIRLFQLGGGEFPALKVLHRTTLPVQLSALIGRERELDEAGAILRQTRLLTLTGPGGSGKTRLGLQLAAEAVDDFPDGLFWVSLAAVSDPELVPPTIAEAIGADDGLAAHIAARRLLVVLDNLEQVLDAAPELATLLGAAPNLKLLVTSRAPLRITGEREYSVEPLPTGDAVRLFAERAVAIVPSFEPDPAVEEICRRLDGLPLAVELAAARVRVFRPAELLRRLESRLPLLAGGGRDAPERQRTLRATIEWSYDLLDGEEQRLFARLGIFAGSFDVDAAETVCGAPVDLLEALIEQSLVRRWESGRFGMLETIREFAVEELRESGERDVVGRAHLDYFLALAYGAGEEDGWLERLDAERDNFRAAMRWGLDNGSPRAALQLASALGRFWVIRAHGEGYAWLSEALAAAPDAPPGERGNGLLWAGSTLAFTADQAGAEALFEQALPLVREAGDRGQVAEVLDRLAGARAMRGDFEAGMALAEGSIAMFREIGDPASARYALSKVAGYELECGDRARGRALFEEVLALARDVDDAWLETLTLLNLATAHIEAQEVAAGAALARQAVSLAHEIGNAPTLVWGLQLLTRVAAAEGHKARAGELWGAVDAYEARGDAFVDPSARAQFEALFDMNADFDAGRARGRALSAGEAVALALEGGSRPV